MIGEFAILPRALRQKSYEVPELARVCLRRLFDCVRNEAVARNIGGKWSEAMSLQAGLHPCSRELLEYLIKEGRLVPDRVNRPRVPSSDQEWWDLAMDSHNRKPLDLIVTRCAEVESRQLPKVATEISDLEQARWWRMRSESIPVKRTLEGYLEALDPIAKLSRRIVIIDPYLNPRDANYAAFPNLLLKLIEVNPSLFIEIHVKERGSQTTCFEPFESALSAVKWNGQFELHIWKNFHDRFLISNLFGISMPRGLEILPCKGEPLVWNRLSPEARIQKLAEFDPARQKMRHLKAYSATGGRITLSPAN